MLVLPYRSFRRRFLSTCLTLFPLQLLVVAAIYAPGTFALREDQSGDEKESRSAAQKKIDSQLLYAIYQMRGQAKKKGTPTAEIRLRKDEKGRVLVDVRAQVTEKLVSRITKLGGAIVSRSERYHSILAYLPLGKLETLAKSKDVKFISPAAESTTH